MRAIGLCTAVLLAAVAAACGEEKKVSTAIIQGEVESAASEANENAFAPRAECPKQVEARKGATFTCRLKSLKGPGTTPSPAQTGTAKVTITDDAGTRFTFKGKLGLFGFRGQGEQAGTRRE